MSLTMRLLISLKHLTLCEMDTKFCSSSLDIGHIYPKHLPVSLFPSLLDAAAP